MIQLGRTFPPCRGGVQNLGKPELEKVWQRRRADADGKPGSIRPAKPSSNSTPANDELAVQLAKRSSMLEEVSNCDRMTVGTCIYTEGAIYG